MQDEEPRISLPVEPQISYSVKEILKRIEDKVDDLIRGLAFKADTSHVESLNQRVDRAEDRITAIEHRNQSRDEHERGHAEWKRWLIPTVLTAALTVATILSLLHHL